jgi:hypothetical protein
VAVAAVIATGLVAAAVAAEIAAGVPAADRVVPAATRDHRVEIDREAIAGRATVVPVPDGSPIAAVAAPTIRPAVPGGW